MSIVSCGIIPMSRSCRDWLRRRFIFRAPDQQPEERQFPSSENHGELANALRGRGQKKRDRGADHVAEARNHGSDADKARDKAGSHHGDAERKEPQSPKDLSQDKSLVVQTEKEKDERVALRRSKAGQELGATREGDRGE